MKQLFAVGFLCILLSAMSCNSNKDTVIKQTPITYNNDTIVFFPINNFIAEEIKNVTSTPHFIYRFTTTGHRKDSTILNNSDFIKATEIFLQHDISDSTIKNFYKEAVFQDESTNSYTFSYSTQNEQLPVQNVDVLFNPDNRQVKRLFIKMFHTAGDSTIITRLGWKANESCSITQSFISNGKEKNVQSDIIWNAPQ